MEKHKATKYLNQSGHLRHDEVIHAWCPASASWASGLSTQAPERPASAHQLTHHILHVRVLHHRRRHVHHGRVREHRAHVHVAQAAEAAQSAQSAEAGEGQVDLGGAGGAGGGQLVLGQLEVCLVGLVVGFQVQGLQHRVQ